MYISDTVDRRALLRGGSAMASMLVARPLLAGNTATTQAGVTHAPAIPDLPVAAPQSVGMAADLSARIGLFMQGEIAAGRLTGGVTAVARHGRLVHFAAHGSTDPSTGEDMQGDAIFRMMSSGKPITAVALLQMMEEGRIDLDDKVSSFLPMLTDFRVAASDGSDRAGMPVTTVPANREITVRDLATHTSGLNGFLTDIPAAVPFTLAARVPYARFIPLDFQPGTRWAYSAVTGPDILARIVEITSGLPFDRYLHERIFEPVGMKDTAYNLSPRQRTRVLPRFTRENNAWVRAPDDTELAQKLLPRTSDQNARATYFSGSFGLFSTARDYLQFESMLLSEGSIHGRRVLQPQSVKLMRSNLVGDLYDGGVAYPGAKGTGFGVQVRTILDADACECGRAEGVFAWGGAYGTTSWSDPVNDLLAIFFVQQRNLATEREFGDVIYGALKG